MINFARLALTSGVRSDFVGVAPRAPDDRPYFTPHVDGEVTHTFHLPYGFEGFGVHADGSLDYSAVKGLFFQLYRGFNRFVREQPKRAKPRAEDRQAHEDQRRQTEGLGSSVQPEAAGTRLSALTELTEVLLALPELNMTRLEQPYAAVPRVDYSKLHRYLDRCVYLDDGAAFIDSMDLPRNELRSGYADLLGMYCFILDSILTELDDDVALPGPEEELIQALVDAKRLELSAVAERFRDRHLSPAAKLFSEEEGSHVTLVLEELLAEIDQHVGYRDRDYHVLYEACERFLYGSLDPEREGTTWGLQRFSLLWEDLCHTWFFSSGGCEVLYADCDLPKRDLMVNATASQASRSQVGNLRLSAEEEGAWVYISARHWEEEQRSLEASYSMTVPFNYQKDMILLGGKYLKIESEKQKYNIQSLLSVSFNPSYGYYTRRGMIERIDPMKSHKSKKRNHVVTRLLRPDLVTSNTADEVVIWDYKYVSSDLWRDGGDKLTYDLSKSLAYEAALGGWAQLKLGANRFLTPWVGRAVLSPETRSAWAARSRGVAVWGLDLVTALNRYVTGEVIEPAHPPLSELLPATASRPAPVNISDVSDLVSADPQSTRDALVNYRPILTVRGEEEAQRVHKPIQKYLKLLLDKLNIQPAHYVPYTRGVDLGLDLKRMHFKGEPALSDWLEREVFTTLGPRGDDGQLTLNPSLMLTLDDDCAPLTCELFLNPNSCTRKIHRVGALMYGPSVRPERVACLTVRIHPFWLFDMIKGRKY